MEEDQEAIFRKLMENQEEKPSPDFTRMIMQTVNVHAAEESLKESELIHLLTSASLTEAPSNQFNAAIMNRIVVPKALKAEAIISPRVWYMIAASLALIFFGSYFLISPGAAPATPAAADLAMSGVYTKVNTLPIIYPVTFFAMGLLMVTDYFLRQKAKTSTSI